VVNWGESTFIQGGINAAINHFDVSALRHLDITPTTAITRWTGEALDLGLAVEVLMQRRAKSVPAETSADGGR